MRPPVRATALDEVINHSFDRIADPGLRQTAAGCLLNTWETTAFLMDDQTSYVVTGDINAMWLRDSSCQVEPYLRFAAGDPLIQRMLMGLAQRQARCLVVDPYANAFNPEPSGVEQFPEDHTAKNPWVFERKYELDSLCHPVRFWWNLWRATGDRALFTPQLHQALTTIVATMRLEQRHEFSGYSFERSGGPASDTLTNAGKGSPVGYTGMVWSGFRPSDDCCRYHYLIPAELFAARILLYIAAFADEFYQDAPLMTEAQQLRREILAGVQRYGVVEHPRCGPIYAYEVDGLGGINLMDDANIPSLLSLPYLGICPPDDPLYLNTRNFVLSQDNPYYYEGKLAQGIGSPHTPKGYIWPMSIIIQGMTARDPEEADRLLQMVLQTTGGTGLMHESFNPADPAQFSRPWFAWANSLFSEWMLRRIGYQLYNPFNDSGLAGVMESA